MTYRFQCRVCRINFEEDVPDAHHATLRQQAVAAGTNLVMYLTKLRKEMLCRKCEARDRRFREHGAQPWG